MKTTVKVIIGLASATAAGMAFGVIPNPFQGQHEAAAVHRVHEMKVRWNHDGKVESIPIIEQGVPFDDTKYFDQVPLISPNPTETTGVFQFDYEIEQYFSIDGRSGNLRYKVNSNDNSMYVHGTEITENPLFVPLKSNPFLQKYTFEFLIRNAKNDWMLFMTHAEEGKLCIKMPSGLSFSGIITDQHLKTLEVLNSAKENAGLGINNSGLEPYKGHFTDENGHKKQITFWMAKEEAQIATGVPIMGFGVGVFKNVLEHRQQFLAVTETNEGVMKLLNLEKIDTWGITTKNYRIIAFDYHLPSGKARVDDVVSWLKNKQNEITNLRAQRKNCPSHQKGRECRKAIDNQIKQIQEEIASKATDLGKQYFPPVN